MTNYLTDAWHHTNLSYDWYLKKNSSDILFSTHTYQFLDGPFQRYNERNFELARQEMHQMFLNLFGTQNTPLNLVIEFKDLSPSEDDIKDAVSTIPWQLPRPIDTQHYTFVDTNPSDLDIETDDTRVTSFIYDIDSNFVLQNNFFERIVNRDFPDRTPRWNLSNENSDWSIYFMNDKIIYFPLDDIGAWVTFLDDDDYKSFQTKFSDIIYAPEKAYLLSPADNLPPLWYRLWQKIFSSKNE